MASATATAQVSATSSDASWLCSKRTEHRMLSALPVSQQAPCRPLPAVCSSANIAIPLFFVPVAYCQAISFVLAVEEEITDNTCNGGSCQSHDVPDGFEDEVVGLGGVAIRDIDHM